MTDGIKRLRYLAPNLITLASLLFGLLSIRMAAAGRVHRHSIFAISAP